MSAIPPGRHPNHCRCRGCRRDIARFESGLMKFDIAAVAICAAIAGIIWVVLAPLRIWHVTGADGQQHPDAATWAAYGTGGAVIMGCLMFFSIRASAKAARKAPVRVPVTVGDLRPPPACEHPDAEPLVNRVSLGPVAWFCAECDTPLPREFGDARRSCCGTEPGRSHFGNCFHAVKR